MSFSSSINLSSLNGTTGFRLDGVAAGNGSGWSVASAGDVNGDGVGDLIIAASGAGPNSNNLSGSSYVVFGKASGFTSAINLSSLNGTTGFRLDGVAAGDESGSSVASAGDVNGDGFADLIIGAFHADPNGKSDSGSSYVVFGQASGFTSAINLSSLNGTTGFRLNGVTADDASGNSVATAGDVNGDGFADLIIGAPHSPAFSPASGSSYVVFGKPSGFTSAINLASLNGSTGFRLNGVADEDRTGISVASAGDVNGDGFADLIVGAGGADPHGSDSGSSYVVFGKSSVFTAAINLTSLDGTSGFRLDGVGAGDGSGNSVAAAGDVNGDGFADLIVASSGADPNSINGAGSSYIIFGKPGVFASAINLSSLDLGAGFRLDGVATSDASGNSVAAAGDVNGDGRADLVIGAYLADPNGNDSGSSYIYLSPASGGATYRGTTLADRLSGTSAGDTIDGYSGNDILNGNAGDDTITGGTGNDTITGGTGNDTIDGGVGNDTVKWAPGDGNDTVTLGTGTNSIDFGANAYTNPPRH